MPPITPLHPHSDVWQYRKVAAQTAAPYLSSIVKQFLGYDPSVPRAKCQSYSSMPRLTLPSVEPTHNRQD